MGGGKTHARRAGEVGEGGGDLLGCRVAAVGEIDPPVLLIRSTQPLRAVDQDRIRPSERLDEARAALDSLPHSRLAGGGELLREPRAKLLRPRGELEHQADETEQPTLPRAIRTNDHLEGAELIEDRRLQTQRPSDLGIEVQLADHRMQRIQSE